MYGNFFVKFKCYLVLFELIDIEDKIGEDDDVDVGWVW